MTLSPGTRLGPYEITSLLGKGGMGEVYCATDTRLRRTVAIKTSRNPLDPRLQREARAASALNHPNICTIHDIGEEDGHAYIVMEYIEGQTLKEVIAAGALPADLLVKTATQIADALEAAHGAGIVHRDMKPANVLLTSRGQVKVLDFGLAKDVSFSEDLSTETALTTPGAVLGTVPYMSPEQAQGKRLDARTDLFSFGVMLFEMATGTRPFQGATSATILGAILHAEAPDPLSLNRTLNPGWRAIIGKSLHKDRELRYQHAGDIRADLARLGGSVVASAKERPSGRGWLAVAALAVVAALAGAYYLRPPDPPTERHTLVLANFKNSIGDAGFDTLRLGLSKQIGQSPSLSLLPDAQIEATLRLMVKAPGTELNAELAREVCERTGGSAVVEGSIDSLGSQYVLGLSARDCVSGKVLDEEQTQAARKEEVAAALDVIAAEFRSRVALALAETHPAAAMEEVTTASMEALRAYSTGFRINNTKSAVDAVPHFKRAVQLDPLFAFAHAQLGLAYYNGSEIGLANESARRAFELRERASEHERFFITWLFHRNVTGNMEKAWEAVQAWAQAYPRDFLAQGLCAGFSSTGTGHFHEALEHAAIAAELNPSSQFSALNIGYAHLLLDEFEAAETAIARRSDLPDFLPLRYVLAFVRNDSPAMENVLLLGKGKSGIEDLLTHVAALSAAYHGRLRASAELSRRAVDLAKVSGKQERAALFAAGAAASHAVLGDSAGANLWANEALTLSKGRDPEYAAAFALQLSGGSTRARQIADDLAQRFPEDTSVQMNYLPTLRGLFARTTPAQAVAVLQASLANESGVPALANDGYYGHFYPVYVRGEAYLALKQGGAASAEFQKIIDHRGLTGPDPIGALARLQLARALVLQGQKSKATASYAGLLEIWKGGDADLAPLKQAREELAALGK